MSKIDKKQQNLSVNKCLSNFKRTETMQKKVEEDYQKFNELIHQNLFIEKNLEKELAAEDKKCTFLQYKIQHFRKRYIFAEQICLSQEKQVVSQRAELETINFTIQEQMKKLKTKFPEEGLSYYSDMVTIISSMVQYVDNFKKMLNDISIDCNHCNTEIEIRKDELNQLIRRIHEMIQERDLSENKLKELLQLCTPYDFEELNQNASILNDTFHEYLKIKNEATAVNTEKENLQITEKQNIEEFKTFKEKMANIMKKYDSIAAEYIKKFNELRKEGMNIEIEYYKMVNEWDTLMNNVYEQMRILKAASYQDKMQLEALCAQELLLKNENDEISSQIENLNKEFLELNAQRNSIKEQEEFLVKIKLALQQQINVDEQTKLNCEVEIRNRMEEEELLKTEYDALNFKSEKPTEDNEKLIQLINLEEAGIQDQQLENQKLESNVTELRQTIKTLEEISDKMKNDLTLLGAEYNFLETTLSDMQKETDNMCENEMKKINEKLTDTIENTNELANSLFEKKIVIDSLQNDIQEHTEEYSRVQYQVWSADKENENKRSELQKLGEEIIKEETTLQNKKKLLVDLEKNTFPRDKIPLNWFKSFEKQRKEYELLAKERLELEKHRNKLIIEIDSVGFQKSGPNTPNEETYSKDSANIKLNEDIKTSLYDVFKKRISKKRQGINEPNAQIK